MWHVVISVFYTGLFWLAKNLDHIKRQKTLRCNLLPTQRPREHICILRLCRHSKVDLQSRICGVSALLRLPVSLKEPTCQAAITTSARISLLFPLLSSSCHLPINLHLNMRVKNCSSTGAVTYSYLCLYTSGFYMKTCAMQRGKGHVHWHKGEELVIWSTEYTV